jgi:hypothetical protein
MRDIILGRKVGSANTVLARRREKWTVEACERRILEFPLGMDPREVPNELKREGWQAVGFTPGWPRKTKRQSRCFQDSF